MFPLDAMDPSSDLYRHHWVGMFFQLNIPRTIDGNHHA